MEKPIPSYAWVLPLSFVWPVTQLAIFYARFNRMPVSQIWESVVFLPGGLIGGYACIEMMRRSERILAKNKIVMGFLIASPFALFVSFGIGLLLPPWFGVTIAIGGILSLGSWLGYRAGQKAVTAGN